MDVLSFFVNVREGGRKDMMLHVNTVGLSVCIHHSKGFIQSGTNIGSSAKKRMEKCGHNLLPYKHKMVQLHLKGTFRTCLSMPAWTAGRLLSLVYVLVHITKSTFV